MPGHTNIDRGIILILVAALGIVFMNTSAKMSRLAHGPVEMDIHRGIVALGIMVPLMLIGSNLFSAGAHHFSMLPIRTFARCHTRRPP